MAIKKKGNIDFLRDTTVSVINETGNKEELSSDNTTTDTSSDSKKAAKHKDINKWGRPRKSLIEGVKEKSITVQLPITLIAVLRKEGKRTKKSIKEVIGEALLDKYGDLIK